MHTVLALGVLPVLLVLSVWAYRWSARTAGDPPPSPPEGTARLLRDLAVVTTLLVVGGVVVYASVVTA